MSDFTDVTNLIYSIRDKAMLDDFLMGITTPKERLEISQRLKIVNELIEGRPQHAIADELGVGIATVTRGSKELSLGRFKVLRGKS